MIGTVVVNDRTFQIERLMLRDGKLIIQASCIDSRAHGVVSGVPATVFGEDGRGVCQGWNFEIPATERHAHVSIELPIQITVLENESAG